MTISETRLKAGGVEGAPSVVNAVPPAPSDVALAHFARLLELETDCSDVAAALSGGATDFVLLDVRGAGAFAAGHVAGAINLPHRDISADTLASFPADTTLVVYCAGQHCNGADRAAVAIARLGRPVKKMLGGVTGWRHEGLPLTTAR